MKEIIETNKDILKMTEDNLLDLIPEKYYIAGEPNDEIVITDGENEIKFKIKELSPNENIFEIQSKEKYDKDELEVGKNIEEEHKPTYNMIKNVLKETGELPSEKEVYERIAKDHLDEYNNYYTGLVEMEEKLEEEEKNMEEVVEKDKEEEINNKE